MRRFVPSRHLPLVAGVAMLIFPALVLFWNLAALAFDEHLAFLPAPLSGVVSATVPALSWESLRSGAYQRDASQKIGSLTPIYGVSVRLKNQLLYSVFGRSPVSAVALGQEGEFYEWMYIDEYCSRDLAKFAPLAEEWATKLEKLRDHYAREGKPFLYVVTPSKAAQYPQYFPAGFECRAPTDDRLRLMEAYRGVLDRHHVRYVDATRIVAAAQEAYSIPLFAQKGTHWNLIAASLAVQAITDAVNDQRPANPLSRLAFGWAASWKPKGTDRDLLELLNLQWPDDHYPVPVVSFAQTTPANGCRPNKISEVGGSFVGQLNEALRGSSCRPEIVFWYYFSLARWSYEGDTVHVEQPLYDEVAEARERDLRGADIVLLEENENQVARSRHAQALYDLVIRE